LNLKTKKALAQGIKAFFCICNVARQEFAPPKRAFLSQISITKVMEDFEKTTGKATFVAYDPELQLQHWHAIMEEEMPTPHPITRKMVKALTDEVAAVKRQRKKDEKLKKARAEHPQRPPEPPPSQALLTDGEMLAGGILIVGIVVLSSIKGNSNDKQTAATTPHPLSIVQDDIDDIGTNITFETPRNSNDAKSHRKS
jgi:hypothetical protein